MYTEMELRTLQKLIESGDSNAMKELKQNGDKLVNRANTRLRALEKNDLKLFPYRRAINYIENRLDSKRFSKSVKRLGGIDGYIEQYRELKRFLEAESSKVSRAREIVKQRYETLKDVGINIEENNANKFFEFIGSDTVQDLFETTGTSDILMDLIAENLNKHHKTIRGMERDFNKYLNGDLSYDTLIERLGGDVHEVFKRTYRSRQRKK